MHFKFQKDLISTFWVSAWNSILTLIALAPTPLDLLNFWKKIPQAIILSYNICKAFWPMTTRKSSKGRHRQTSIKITGWASLTWQQIAVQSLHKFLYNPGLLFFLIRVLLVQIGYVSFVVLISPNPIWVLSMLAWISFSVQYISYIHKYNIEAK